VLVVNAVLSVVLYCGVFNCRCVFGIRCVALSFGCKCVFWMHLCFVCSGVASGFCFVWFGKCLVFYCVYFGLIWLCFDDWFVLYCMRRGFCFVLVVLLFRLFVVWVWDLHVVGCIEVLGCWMSSFVWVVFGSGCTLFTVVLFVVFTCYLFWSICLLTTFGGLGAL